MRFKDKVVLVTGGASGIGQAVCLAFAREGAGIGIADKNLENSEVIAQKIREMERNALALKVDVTCPDSVMEMVKKTVGELGQIDILVNSAGIREVVSFLTLSFEQWQDVIATNLTGTFLCGQAVAQYLVKSGRSGKIVNIASVMGFLGSPNRAAYVSSKHGVVGLTKAMAIELGPKNIRVNAVAPATTETGMTAAKFADPEYASSVRKTFPVGRWGKPDDIAKLVLFLASEEADFITGATYIIDGGYSAGKAI